MPKEERKILESRTIYLFDGCIYKTKIFSKDALDAIHGTNNWSYNYTAFKMQKKFIKHNLVPSDGRGEILNILNHKKKNFNFNNQLLFKIN